MNDKLIRSEWYPGNVSPIYSGVYERNYNNGVGEASIYFCHYDTLSDSWGIGLVSITEAENYPATITRAGNQHLPWRGVDKTSQPTVTIGALDDDRRDAATTKIGEILNELLDQPVRSFTIAAVTMTEHEVTLHTFAAHSK